MAVGDDPLRQAEAKAYRRAARRRGRAGQAVLESSRAWRRSPAFASRTRSTRRARSSSTRRSTPGRRSPRSGSPACPSRSRAGAPRAARGSRASGLPSWLGDQGKSLAIGAVLAPFAMTGLVAALREWPHGWWLPVSAARSRSSCCSRSSRPSIVPLFMRSHPLPPGPLADDLHALAARGGVRVRALRVSRRAPRPPPRTRSWPATGRRAASCSSTRCSATIPSRGAAGRDALGARARARPPRAAATSGG